MHRRTKVFGGLFGAALLVGVIRILFEPTAVCACTTPAEAFAESYLLDPETAEPAVLRDAILETLPLGSPADQVDVGCVRFGSTDDRRHCDLVGNAYVYDQVLAASPLGLHQIELRIDLVLDAEHRLANVVVTRRRRFFGLAF
jgi:hypothetical protein